MSAKPCSVVICLCLIGTWLPTTAAADTLVFEPGGGQVNLSGATLFAPFYPTLASTNDFINADNDFTPCVPPAPMAGFFDSDCDTFPDAVDQLAANFVPGGTTTTFWAVNIRSVGSGNGLAEFRDFQLCGKIPTTPPSELGQFNRFKYAEDAEAVYAGVNASGTPFLQTSIDIAVMDVPTGWFVTVDGTPHWSLSPGADGYGLNPTKSWSTPTLAGGQSNKLKDRCSDCDGNGSLDACLNTRVDNPDANTVFDTPTAWVPIAIISNRGTGIENISVSELQYLFVTGRLPSGENLKAVTRDAGSGTRNGAMNSLCIDPSWGRGDNLGKKFDDSALARLGASSQWVNCGGSGVMEAAVQNHGLGLGYTGVAGGGRAADDATNGRYEILGVIKDQGTPVCGAGTPVRPTIAACIDNDDPCTGYQIGGPQSFASLGDPNANRAVGDPRKTSNPPMANNNAAQYLNNLTDSIASFSGAPGLANKDFFMPGEWLADSFFLPAGVAALPALDSPCDFLVNTELNTALYQYMLDNNDFGFGGDTPAYGLECAGLVPARVGLTAPDTYTDGSTLGDYFYKDNGGILRSIGSGQTLSARNRLMGDFNDDGARNIEDIARLMEAVDLQLDFDTTDHGGCDGDMVGDYLIVTVVGDFDGDGNFDAEDVRYFADGLALKDGLLDRKQGFTDVDDAWLTLKGDANYFATTLATCKVYAAGDSRGDVAGSANGPTPGAMPLGADGIVDIVDVEYVKANIADWLDLAQAAAMDLSADMNGDLAVDCTDVAEIVEVILGTKPGDLDLDGCVDNDDLAVLQANSGVVVAGAAYADGDLDCDGDVDGDDESILQANLGFCMDCLAQTEVTGRFLFYNDSYYDGNNPGIDLGPNGGTNHDHDDDAIDPTKSPLLPGTGQATTANYTGFVDGITGLMFDVVNPTAVPALADFTFTDIGKDGLGAIPVAPTGFAVRPGAGVGGSDRVVVTFTGLVNTWLEVTIGTGFGLPSPDVSYWGDVFAEGQSPGSANYILVNATDVLGARDNTHNPANRALVDDEYDYNKDSLVNATDILAARDHTTNPTTAVRRITR